MDEKSFLDGLGNLFRAMVECKWEGPGGKIKTETDHVRSVVFFGKVRPNAANAREAAVDGLCGIFEATSIVVMHRLFATA